MKIILASGSPRRAKILEAAGVAFVVRKTDMGEVLLPPYRLHYADVIRFSLRSFLGIKSVRQEGIEL